ncbi:MAG: polyprenyl synthetase family protein [Gudongella sp.]|nr:polyprenyl synthetase family protein [Gudongella sp.]
MKSTNQMEEYIALIDESLRNALYPGQMLSEDLSRAIEYSLFTGGKRLRPIMTLKAYELYDNYIHNAMPFAAAIEMIHTYSLIHDDLPAMDNDDLRRGRPTTHKVYGDANAILAGDALLNLAFETMLKWSVKKPDERKNRAMYEIAIASGQCGMVGGQVLDIKAENKTITEEELFKIYKGKTAALIKASILSGAIVGGASENDIEALRKFSIKLGLAYQMQDDILDDIEDEKIDKNTILKFYSKEEAIKKIEIISNEALEILDSLSHLNTEFFKDLTLKLVNRTI